MTPDAGPRPPRPPGHDTARHQAARELRRQHPQWVVLWLTGTGRYHGYPLYTQRSIVLTAEQPADLAAQMQQAEQAARKPSPRPEPDGIKPWRG